jgi:hypothetical protein
MVFGQNKPEIPYLSALLAGSGILRILDIPELIFVPPF